MIAKFLWLVWRHDLLSLIKKIRVLGLNLLSVCKCSHQFCQFLSENREIFRLYQFQYLLDKLRRCLSLALLLHRVARFLIKVFFWQSAPAIPVLSFVDAEVLPRSLILRAFVHVFLFQERVHHYIFQRYVWCFLRFNMYEPPLRRLVHRLGVPDRLRITAYVQLVSRSLPIGCCVVM